MTIPRLRPPVRSSLFTAVTVSAIVCAGCSDAHDPPESHPAAGGAGETGGLSPFVPAPATGATGAPAPAAGGSGGVISSAGASGIGTGGSTGGVAGGNSPAGGADPGASGASGTIGSAGAPAPDCVTTADCHDGHACTWDSCDAGRCVHDESGCALDPGSETLSTSVEFMTTGYQLLSDNSYTPLMNDGTSSYFVWVDQSFHPQVTHITGDLVTTVRLDPSDDYQVRDDGHHKFSLGIDADGYVHIAGDMHHHPASNTDHLPDRYRESRIMYWVSDAPHSAASFTFQGHDASRAITGYGFSYGSFHVAPDGTLYYLSRIRVHELGHHPGEMGLGLSRYSTTTRSWEALGALPPSSRESQYPCVVWEDNGHGGSFYQGFRSSIRFDAYGRLHLTAALNNDDDVDAPTHVVYAASDDGGVSFQLADGSPVTELPLRVDPVPGQANVVAGPLTDLDLFAGVFFDGNGIPGVVYSRNLDRLTGSYRYFDSATSTWSERLTSPVGGWIREKHHVDRSGILTFIEQSGNIERTREFDVAGATHTARVDGQGIWLHSIDELALRRDDVWRGVFELRDAPGMGVVRLVWSGGTP